MRGERREIVRESVGGREGGKEGGGRRKERWRKRREVHVTSMH